MKSLLCIGLGMLVALVFPSAGALAHGELTGRGYTPKNGGSHSSPPSNDLIAAWSTLFATCEALAEDVEAERFNDVDRKAELLPELAQALMLHTGDLKESKQKRMKSGVMQLTKAAEHLKTISSAGSEAAQTGDLKRIVRALQLISSQYPEGSLPLSTRPVAGRAGDRHH